MTKLINKDKLSQLDKQLQSIHEFSDILGNHEYYIDGRYYESGDTNATFMSIQYLDSGISEYIEIDDEGRISLDNNTNEYSPMYAEDLVDMAKAADILTSWWKNLPEAK